MSKTEAALASATTLSSRSKLAAFFLGLAAVVGGYATMILGLVLVQDIWFGRIVLSESPPASQLVSVGVGSFLAAALGGAVASLLWRKKSLIPHYVMSAMTVLEVIGLYASGKAVNPVWFEVIADSILVAGIIGLGAVISVRSICRSE